LRPATAALHSIVTLPASARDKKQTTNFIFDLNARLSRDIGYLIRMEPGIQTPEETLCKGSGSCRDTAWLLVQLLRRLGLAARFASGYLVQLKPDVKSLDDLRDRRRISLTACLVRSLSARRRLGWPRSDIRSVRGRRPYSAGLRCQPTLAAPISGAVEPAEVLFDFDMTVTRVKEPPRVTKPYSDEQWIEIEKLGDAVEQVLKNHDVRLTMGGEPTFVSTDDRSGAEWHHCRRRTHQAGIGRQADPPPARPLRAGRDAALWPGQMVSGRKPAALGLWSVWRTDGVPMWKSAGRIAAEDVNHKPTQDDAKTLTEAGGKAPES